LNSINIGHSSLNKAYIYQIPELVGEIKMNDDISRILATIIFLIGAAISIYHRYKADRETGEMASLKDEGLLIFIPLRLFGLCGWLGIFAFILNPDWVTWSRIDLPEWARWLGVGMGILADLLAYWIFTNLGTNVTPTVVTRGKAYLVTNGPYHWVRHPLYVVGLISFIGFALMAENWFIALMAIIVFIILIIRTQKEETKLIEKFGDQYRGYMKHTGRFLPKIGSTR
jgi:protein-S-isoprenylcysteine O-methyltransferase Ste14